MNRNSKLDGKQSAPILSVVDLTVRYEGDREETIRKCSFDVQEGQIVLVSGPSGSGKSTLAMAVAGIVPRSIEAEVEGRITFAHGENGHHKRVGYVFQDPNVQFCMHTVADELAFGLENEQVRREEMSEIMVGALAAVALDVAADGNHHLFSGGMKQKLAVASLLAMDVDFLILDEPTANLDPAATHAILQLLVELRNLGKTILVIEHKYAPLLPFIDQVVEMDCTGTIAGVWTGQQWIARISEGELSESVEREPAAERPKALVACHGQRKPLLVADSLHLRYGDVSVWKDVSVDFSPGEWVAIVGPNGAGKSSLVEVLAGLSKPTYGTLQLKGRAMEKVSKRDLHEQISFGFQNPEYHFLYERVADEMAGAVVGETIPDEVLEALRIFGLEKMALLSPYQLSQGQKRRLSVAVMLRQNADLYFFDEPTYGQDKETEALILSHLQSLHLAKKCVVTVTHDMDLVKKFATRVIVIADGGIQYDGSVSNLLSSPEILRKAHLLDDERPLQPRRERVDKIESIGHSGEYNKPVLERENRASFKSPLGRMHPGVKVITLLVISVMAMFTNDLSTVLDFWVLIGVLLFGLGWCSPRKLAKTLWPLVVLYIIYIWTFAANAAVPPGTHVVHVLWFQVSRYGFMQGILVSLRTFLTVVLAYLFVVTTDQTNFVVSMSQTFHVPPKFSYGFLAGTSYIGRFTEEIRIFRLARQVRGRSGRLITRPVTYALPMLSQAIRLSERVAMAMEARGFYGRAADSSVDRTYFRATPIRRTDIPFALILLLCAVFIRWFL